MSGVHGCRVRPDPYADYAALLADPRVQIVAINTPPAFHAAQAIAAARAGKHIFCEKPLATRLDDATQVLHVVQEAGVQLSVDYVMRWNPLYGALHRLQRLTTRDGPLLGALRRYALENGAGDEALGPMHWFWDLAISGGIFVEHGVHFFDACAWLMGRQPTHVQGLTTRRDTGPQSEAGPLVDTALASSVYPEGATASFYHAFTHANRAEFQHITLDWGFAHGVLSGWIPVDLVLEIWTDEAGQAELERQATLDLLKIPEVTSTGQEAVEVEVVERYLPVSTWHGRGEPRTVSRRLRLTATLGGEAAKQAVYQASVRAGLADLLAAIRTGCPPAVTGADAWRSLATALAAQHASVQGCTTVPLALGLAP